MIELHLEYMDGRVDVHEIGMDDRCLWFTWKVNPDNCLVLMERVVSNRMVIPLGNVRRMRVHRPGETELRETYLRTRGAGTPDA